MVLNISIAIGMYLSSFPTSTTTELSQTQKISKSCFFLISFICFLGGTVQMLKGDPPVATEKEKNPEANVDNIHRFLGGVYFVFGVISVWIAKTIQQQDFMIYVSCLACFMGAFGRIISMVEFGVPKPKPLWWGYMLSEIIFPTIILISQYVHINTSQIKQN